MLYAVTLDYHQADTTALGGVTAVHQPGSPFDMALRELFAVEEWFFLGTCNRREFYLTTQFELNQTALVDWFEALFAPGDQPLGFQVLRDRAAARHLFEVSASLGSRALGEPEISHQIKQQTGMARQAGLMGRHLGLLATRALKAGKRVRSETRIGRQVVSPLSLIYHRVRQELGRGDRRLVLVGAGDYIRRLAPHFSNDPNLELIFVNRSPNNLADRFGGEFMDLQQFLASPPQFDGLISATASPSPIFSADWLRAAAGPYGLVCFDGATPPDIADAPSLPSKISLITLADLDEVLAANRAERESELPPARAVIEEELESYSSDLDQLQFAPIYREIGAYYQHTPQALARKHLFEGLAADEAVPREAIERFLEYMGRRLAAAPILAVRGVAEAFGQPGVAAAVQAMDCGSDLFGAGSAGLMLQ